MTDVLDLIDGAISDWETSPDAMRWSAEPPAEEPVHNTGTWASGNVFVAPIGSSWSDAGWQSLGWCSGDGIEWAALSEGVERSWSAVRMVASGFTVTVRIPAKAVSPKLYRLMFGARLPKLRRMHSDYSRRLRARRRRRR